MSSLYRLLQNALNHLLRHPYVVLAVGVVATLFSIYVTQKIQLRTNFADLLPDHHPAVLEAKEIEKIVGGSSFIVVTVRSDDPEAADHFLTDLHNQIQGAEEIRYIDDRPPTDFFQKNGLLYLPPSGLDQIYEKLKTRIDLGKLKKTRLFIDLEENEGLHQEIEGLQKKYAAYLQSTPRYQNREGNLFVSLIKPEWRATDVSKTKKFLSILENLLSELKPGLYHPSLRVRLTGPYVKAVTQQKILLKDAVLVSIIAFVGAILYLFIHFRSLRSVLLIGLPLSVSSIWTLAVAYLLFGSLNLFSFAVYAILLGLGVDYGIHIYSEYSDLRHDGKPVSEALTISMKHLGRAFLVASMTTAAAFLSLTLSQFKALYEFGMIAGIGIFLCVITYVTSFPSLVQLVERWRPTPSKFIKRDLSIQKPPQWVFGTRLFLMISLFLLVPLFFIGRLQFDYNLNHVLGNQETKGLDAEVDRIFDHTVNPEVALVKNPEDAPLLAAAIRKTEDSRPASERTVAQVLSLADLVPADQLEKKKKIAQIKSLFTPTVIRGFSNEEANAYQQFEPFLHPGRVSLQDLPEQLLNKFRDREGGLGRMVFVFQNFDIQEGHKLTQFIETLRETYCPECSGPFYTSGETTLFYEIVKMLFHEGKYVIGFSIGAIFLALLFNYRSLTQALIVFAPLFLGFIATLGWMGLLGIPFNIINLASLPVILGTSDDYAIHLYERYRMNPERNLHQIYKESFTPILGSALTTLIGFGSLWFANMGGVRSFGTVCAMGIFFCALTNLTWFPAFLALIKKRPQENIESILIPQETLE